MTDESIWSKAQPRGISQSLPRRKTGLASNTKKSYIKSKSHCLIFYQSIVGGLYTIISEGKFTQSKNKKTLESEDELVYSCVGLYPKNVEHLVLETGLEIRKLMRVLVSLELQGYIKKFQRIIISEGRRKNTSAGWRK